MSDNEEEKPLLPYEAALGKRIAKCKKCKLELAKGELRVAKVSPNNPFGPGPMKNWYHVDCLFEMKTKKEAQVLDSLDLVEGWDLLSEEHKDLILEKINTFFPGASASSKPSTSTKQKRDDEDYAGKNFKADSKDNLFKEFRRIVVNMTNESSYLKKTGVLNKFLIKGSNGKQFEGNLYLWLKLLMPGVVRRIYNIQSKQIVKLFSRIFSIDHQDMLLDLEQGDVSETVAKYFEKSKKVKPASKSNLTIQEVDEFLEKLSNLTQEDPQKSHFEKICYKCTTNDLKYLIRLIKHDLRMNSGARHVLDALNADAYNVFQTSKDLGVVLSKFSSKITPVSDAPRPKKSEVGLQLMIPISPMLAEACKDLDRAIDKSPNGFFSEIKYDGERLQIHKKGKEFKFYSRNLKPVQEHKISRIKEFLPKAFPDANDLILDSEILMVNTETGELLPFGTLGKHKKDQFHSAEVCLFIFDCVYYNGMDLTKKKMKERKKFLEDNIKPIKNHIEMSEYKLLENKNDLISMIQEVLQKGLEGLVLKDVNGIYEPGKRHWLKVKKDYLCDGKMADTADLVVLGGWFGTGKKGGLLSIFLMGTFDPKSKIWKTVTKVHSGLDDNTIEELQNSLMSKMERCNPDRLPNWMKCNRTMIPDYISKENPEKSMPVWEITGAEFSKAEIHTADGISIRFPRITKMRDDKKPKDATNLQELKHLFEESKKSVKLEFLEEMRDDDSNSKKSNGSSDKPAKSSGTKKISEFFSAKPEKRKASVTEEPTSSTSDSKKFKMSLKEECGEIFSSIKLFVPENLKEKLKNELVEFKSLGGRVKRESLECNYALHEDKIEVGKLEELKKIYNVHCRHVQQKWLIDSVNEKLSKDPLYYCVLLKQE